MEAGWRGGRNHRVVDHPVEVVGATNGPSLVAGDDPGGHPWQGWPERSAPLVALVSAQRGGAPQARQFTRAFAAAWT